MAFSVRELADLAGMTKGRMERLLATNEVAFTQSGNRRLVFVASLERALPEVCDSIRLRDDDE